MSEFHIYGPPGCGKTTYAARQIALAVDKHGPNRVMVTSFTRAAATELAGRELPIPKHMLGTLHSLCARALSPEGRGFHLAESQVAEFNENYPHYAVTGGKRDVDDGMGDAPDNDSGQPGDRLLAEYQLWRARCVDRDGWPDSVTAFAAAWERWKGDELLDYTDLIEHGPLTPPGNPAVIFVDEAQDFNALQFRLVRRWAAASGVESIVFLGDDDQTLYPWAGADPRNLVDAPIPPENRRILTQSHRLPRAVHRFVSDYVQRISHRQAKVFLPRDAEGAVLTSSASLRTPEYELPAVARHVAEGRSVMILASCGYMLRSWIAGLRDAGIPYHNPYRPSRGDWNPLNRKEGGAGQRVSSFVAEDSGRAWWTMLNLALWTGPLKVDGVLRRGAKAQIAELADEHPGYRPGWGEMAQRWFEPGAMRMLEQTPWPTREAMDWYLDHVDQRRRPALAYAMGIALRSGRGALTEPARVTVGTVHSVKGGQADVVYLSPDLSPQAAAMWGQGDRARDDIRRVYYTGMTRARETLVMLKPSGPLAIRV